VTLTLMTAFSASHRAAAADSPAIMDATDVASIQKSLGQTITVRGKVKDVLTATDGRVRIYFGHTDKVVGLIAPENWGAVGKDFGGHLPAAISNRVITITGPVQRGQKGAQRLQVVVTKGSDIRIADVAANAQDEQKNKDEAKAEAAAVIAARAQIVQVTAGDLADLRTELAELRTQVTALLADSSAATASGEKRRAPSKAPPEAPVASTPPPPSVDQDHIRKAIKEQILAVGMTMEDAKQSMGCRGLPLEISEEGEQYQWTITREKSDGSARQSQTILAWFTNGRLTRSTYDLSQLESVERRKVDIGTVSKDRKSVPVQQGRGPVQ
jgi:hypothetical protein